MESEQSSSPSRLKKWFAKKAPSEAKSEAKLVDALKKGDTTRVTRIVSETSKSVAISDESLYMAWDYALQKNQIGLVPVLLQQGIRPDESRLVKIMELAVQKDRSDIIESIAVHGVQPQFETLSICLNQAILRPYPSWLLKSFLKFSPPGDSTIADFALAVALTHSSLAPVEFLLGQGANFEPSLKDLEPNGSCSFLCRLAIDENRIRVLNWLFSKGVSAWSVYGSTSSLVKLTTRPNKTEVIEAILQHGGKPQQRVLLAALYGRKEIVETLIESGVSPNASDEAGNTTLHYAIKRLADEGLELKLQKADLASYLISKSADISAENGLSETVLIKAVEYGRGKITGELLQAGARVDLKTLKIAATAHQSREIDEVILGLLLKFGGNLLIEELDDQSRTLLHLAVQQGMPSAVRQLLMAGANVYAVDKSGSTALHMAAGKWRSDSIAILRILKNGGVELEVENHQGKRPLHIAAESKEYRIMWELRRLGADPKSKTKAGRSVEDIIEEDLLKKLWHKYDDIDVAYPILDYARKGQADVVLDLIKHGANVSMRDIGGNNILHFFNDSRMKRMLILRGADPAEKNIQGRPGGLVYQRSSGRGLGMFEWQQKQQIYGTVTDDMWELVFCGVEKDSRGARPLINFDINGDGSQGLTDYGRDGGDGGGDSGGWGGDGGGGGGGDG